MENLITKEEAEASQQKFLDTRSTVISNALGYEDMNNFYVSLDTLKSYISYVEEQSDIHGYENLGIRFFLGAYEATVDTPSYSTLFLSPTRDNGAVNSKEIKPLNYLKPGKTNY